MNLQCQQKPESPLSSQMMSVFPVGSSVTRHASPGKGAAAAPAAAVISQSRRHAYQRAVMLATGRHVSVELDRFKVTL